MSDMGSLESGFMNDDGTYGMSQAEDLGDIELSSAEDAEARRQTHLAEATYLQAAQRHIATLQARIDVLEQERNHWQSAHDVCCNSGQRLVERIDVLEWHHAVQIQARIDENWRLRDALRTAADNADYIASHLRLAEEWPVLVMKAEAIIALDRPHA